MGRIPKVEKERALAEAWRNMDGGNTSATATEMVADSGPDVSNSQPTDQPVHTQSKAPHEMASMDTGPPETDSKPMAAMPCRMGASSSQSMTPMAGKIYPSISQSMASMAERMNPYPVDASFAEASSANSSVQSSMQMCQRWVNSQSFHSENVQVDAVPRYELSGSSNESRHGNIHDAMRLSHGGANTDRLAVKNSSAQGFAKDKVYPFSCSFQQSSAENEFYSGRSPYIHPNTNQNSTNFKFPQPHPGIQGSEVENFKHSIGQGDEMKNVPCGVMETSTTSVPPWKNYRRSGSLGSVNELQNISNNSPLFTANAKSADNSSSCTTNVKSADKDEMSSEEMSQQKGYSPSVIKMLINKFIEVNDVKNEENAAMVQEKGQGQPDLEKLESETQKASQGYDLSPMMCKGAGVWDEVESSSLKPDPRFRIEKKMSESKMENLAQSSSHSTKSSSSNQHERDQKSSSLGSEENMWEDYRYENHIIIYNI